MEGLLEMLKQAKADENLTPCDRRAVLRMCDFAKLSKNRDATLNELVTGLDIASTVFADNWHHIWIDQNEHVALLRKADSIVDRMTNANTAAEIAALYREWLPTATNCLLFTKISSSAIRCVDAIALKCFANVKQ
jgi:tRNA A37 N6-isopentenylltransferase MiaA